MCPCSVWGARGVLDPGAGKPPPPSCAPALNEGRGEFWTRGQGSPPPPNCAPALNEGRGEFWTRGQESPPPTSCAPALNEGRGEFWTRGEGTSPPFNLCKFQSFCVVHHFPFWTSFIKLSFYDFAYWIKIEYYSHSMYEYIFISFIHPCISNGFTFSSAKKLIRISYCASGVHVNNTFFKIFVLYFLLDKDL